MSRRLRRLLIVSAAAVSLLAFGIAYFFWHIRAAIVLPAHAPPAFTPDAVPAVAAWKETRHLGLRAEIPADWSATVTATPHLLVKRPAPASGAILFSSIQAVEKAVDSVRLLDDYPKNWSLYDRDRRDVLASREELSVSTPDADAEWLARRPRAEVPTGVVEGESPAVRWVLGRYDKHVYGVVHSKDGRWRAQLTAVEFATPDEAAAWVHAVCGRLKFGP